MPMRNAPKFLKKYFWDVDFEKLNLDKSRLFILKRIFEYGDERAAGWMSKNFSRDEITKLLFSIRIDPKSANFWALILDIKRENILCLKRRYLAMRKRIWQY